jgi:hypothetical protein
MKILNYKILFSLLVMVILVGCSTGNKFASSFGKRKYTKGYYFDLAGTKRNPDKLAITQPKLEKVREIKPTLIVNAPISAIITKTEPVFISVIRGKHALKLNNQPPISRISKAPKVLTTDKQLMEPVSQNSAAGDITATKENTVKYTDYGIVSTFATIIWLFLSVFLAALSIPTWEGIGAVFLGAIIVLAIVGFIYCVKSLASNTDLHRNFALILFYGYSLILTVLFVILILAL